MDREQNAKILQTVYECVGQIEAAKKQADEALRKVRSVYHELYETFDLPSVKGSQVAVDDGYMYTEAVFDPYRNEWRGYVIETGLDPCHWCSETAYADSSAALAAAETAFQRIAKK